MLVLSRKMDESIQIDGNITIRILKLKGNQVRLGIEAPQDVRVLRKEMTEWDDEPHDEDGPSAEQNSSYGSAQW